MIWLEWTKLRGEMKAKNEMLACWFVNNKAGIGKIEVEINAWTGLR